MNQGAAKRLMRHSAPPRQSLCQRPAARRAKD
ncbi:hypothetical protein BPC006_I1709 [Burkholderia pseudomallei BPC006]|nr:hypothetical protein BPC006_I1709 [Burkholderia pseudomallei BPC006]